MIASLRETKTRLSEYVRMVEKGEDVIITVRGQPRARLTAIREPRSTDRKAWAKRLSKLQKRFAQRSDSGVSIIDDLRRERS